jgi:hypothetical protein
MPDTHTAVVQKVDRYYAADRMAPLDPVVDVVFGAIGMAAIFAWLLGGGTHAWQVYFRRRFRGTETEPAQD